MENERKFLIDEFPNHLPLLDKALIKQSYLSNPEVRVRENIRENNQLEYVLTIKGEGLLSRPEINLPITKEDYEELLLMTTNKKPIQKIYRKYELMDGHKLECSLVDEGTPTEFMYSEIEFKTVEEATQYEAPAFVGKEVTKDSSYKMKNYWKSSR